MKKLLVLFALCALVLGGCSNNNSAGTSDPTPSAATDEKVVKVGVAIYKFDDNFMTLYRQELKRYLEEDLSKDGVKYQVEITDGQNDQAKQSEQIDSFIAKGVDVMIINLVQSTSAATVVNKCKDANIPCVFINREPTESDMAIWPGKTAYVGADARQSGKFQGEIIAELPDKGDRNGDGVLSYIMIEGDPENVDAKYRTEFSVSQYKEKSGLKVEELLKQRGDWDTAKGQEITTAAIAQFGDKIEVIFSNNDGMALGAVQAIKAAGLVPNKDIYIVGVDNLPEVQELINKGEFTGSVLNDHIGQSHKAGDVAALVASGKDVESNYQVDYVKVTKK